MKHIFLALGYTLAATTALAAPTSTVVQAVAPTSNVAQAAVPAAIGLQGAGAVADPPAVTHPNAITNEPKYINFDRTNPKQAGDMDIIHYAFAGINNGRHEHDLARAALAAIADTADDVFLNWFPPTVTKTNMDARVYVGNVFKKLFKDDTAQPLIGNMVFDAQDFGTSASCGGSVRAYMLPSEGRIHICQLGLESPMVPDKDNCSALGNDVSKAMRSLSSTLLHEMLHSAEVGDKVDQSIGHIGDIKGAYAPEVCYGMAHAKSDVNRQKAFVNDNNYMYLALNAYYNRACGRHFEAKNVLIHQDEEVADIRECEALGEEMCNAADGVEVDTVNSYLNFYD